MISWRRIYYFFSICIILLLNGCNHNLVLLTLAKNTLGSTTDSTTLNPAYRYMRVTISKNVLYLVLDSSKSTSLGTVKNWYSGQGEVVTLLNGRIVKTSGLPVDWYSVKSYHLPPWKSALDKPQKYLRTRDVMPGYHFGVQDAVVLKMIRPPKHSALLKKEHQQLIWYEEKSCTSERELTIPPSRFAIDFTHAKGHIVYSEQCLSQQLCMSFEELPNEPNPQKTLK